MQADAPTMGVDDARLHRVVNWVFRVAPAALVTKRHEVRHARLIRPLLSHDPLFIHVPKSGGQSIAKALGQPGAGHFTFAGMCRLDPTVAERGEYYTVLRDPRDRIRSTYHYVKDLHRRYGTSTLPHVEAATDLNDFIVTYLSRMNVTRHYFLRPVANILEGVPRERLTLIHFGRLADGFALYSAEHLGGEVTLPHVNRSPTSATADVLSREAEIVLSEKYAHDADLFHALGDQVRARASEL